MSHRRHVAIFAGVSALAFAADQLTKVAAARALGDRVVPIGEGSRAWLMLVYNQLSAFGISLGAHTREINIVLTAVAVLLILPVVRALGELDWAAPWGLGLVMGGGLGNLLSLVASPAGVTDFLAVSIGGGQALVMNGADVVVYLGLAALLRTALVLLRAIWVRGARAPSSSAARALREEGAPAG